MRRCEYERYSGHLFIVAELGPLWVLSQWPAMIWCQHYHCVALIHCCNHLSNKIVNVRHWAVVSLQSSIRWWSGLMRLTCIILLPSSVSRGPQGQPGLVSLTSCLLLSESFKKNEFSNRRKLGRNWKFSITLILNAFEIPMENSIISFLNLPSVKCRGSMRLRVVLMVWSDCQGDWCCLEDDTEDTLEETCEECEACADQLRGRMVEMSCWESAGCWLQSQWSGGLAVILLAELTHPLDKTHCCGDLSHSEYNTVKK